MTKAPMNLEELKQIILPLRDAGKTNKQIADVLNKKGHLTTTGKKWTGGNVSILSITSLGLGRKKDTSRGAAGSTGGYSNLNGLRVGPRRIKAPRAGNVYREMEDVMTSNLSPKLKMKLIAVLAKGI